MIISLSQEGALPSFFWSRALPSFPHCANQCVVATPWPGFPVGANRHVGAAFVETENERELPARELTPSARRCPPCLAPYLCRHSHRSPPPFPPPPGLLAGSSPRLRSAMASLQRLDLPRRTRSRLTAAAHHPRPLGILLTPASGVTLLQARGPRSSLWTEPVAAASRSVRRLTYACRTRLGCVGTPGVGGEPTGGSHGLLAP